MDTAQPVMAAETDPNAALAAAANAFKAEVTPPQGRDDMGRYAGKDDPEPVEELEAADATEQPEETVEEDEPEAAEEAQPMPPSWPEDQAGHWESLPPETQAYIAEREGERERAVQAKFQESANVRKAAQAEAEQAQATRSRFAEALDMLSAAIQPLQPDPRHYGYGTEQYDSGGFELAKLEYEAQSNILAQLIEQRESIHNQMQEEEGQQYNAWKGEHEAEWAPKFVSEVPELTDPTKAEGVLRGVVDYANANGLGRFFIPEQQHYLTSDVLHTIWKAQQFDQLKVSKTAPKPKPGPAVKPGVSSPRSAQKTAQRTKAIDRLARDGSIENGAAVFKHFLR